MGSHHWRRGHRLQHISTLYWVGQMGAEGLRRQWQRHSSQTLTESSVTRKWNPIHWVIRYIPALAGYLVHHYQDNGSGLEPGGWSQNICAKHWEWKTGKHEHSSCRHVELLKVHSSILFRTMQEWKTCARRQEKQVLDRARLGGEGGMGGGDSVSRISPHCTACPESQLSPTDRWTV